MATKFEITPSPHIPSRLNASRRVAGGPYLRQIEAKNLAANFRATLAICEVPALVRAAREGVGVRIFSKRNRRFSDEDQRTITQTAALMGLHHCAPEFGAWPVKADDRGHPDTFTFWSN